MLWICCLVDEEEENVGGRGRRRHPCDQQNRRHTHIAIESEVRLRKLAPVKLNFNVQI